MNCFCLCDGAQQNKTRLVYITAHTRKDDIRDGVAFQPSCPKHVFWTNNKECLLKKPRGMLGSPCSTTTSTTPPREDNVKTPTVVVHRRNPDLQHLTINPAQQAHTEVPSRFHRALLRRDALFVENPSVSDYLPFHASSCLDCDSVALMGVREPEVMISQHSSVFGSGADEQHMVPCPLCSFRFPPDCTQQHASACGDPIEPGTV